MAKGQIRSTKEQRKPKADKNKKGTKGVRPHELIASTKGISRPPAK